MMLVNHIIVDDFLSNPDVVRKQALRLNYPSLPGKTYFPGTNSEMPLLIDDIDSVIEELVGEKLMPAPGSAHGKCRITKLGDTGLGNVHIDNAHWSGILYLNTPEQCSGGTDFYRHRASNSERAPVFSEDLATFGYKHGSEVWDDFLLKETNHPEKWEKVFTVPMRYNRLTLFRPWLWHNAGEPFGDSQDTARLVMLLFYVQRS